METKRDLMVRDIEFGVNIDIKFVAAMREVSKNLRFDSFLYLYCLMEQPDSTLTLYPEPISQICGGRLHCTKTATFIEQKYMLLSAS